MEQLLSVATIQDLERCCAELFAVYRRAMVGGQVNRERLAAIHQIQARHLSHWGRPRPDRGIRENRAKFRGMANLYRRHAETILGVLEWAAPEKHREQRLRMGPEDCTVKYHEARPLIGSNGEAHNE
jgi:hypothetical protein